MSDQETAVVTADQWASLVKPRPLVLPSGATVLVRPKSTLALGLKGQGMFTLVEKAIKAQVPDNDLTEQDKKDLADNQKGFDLAKFVIDTVIDHVISPKIVRETPEPGQMDFARISDDDLACIYFDATGQTPKVGGLTGTVDQFRDKWRIPGKRAGSKAGPRKTK